MSDTSPDPQIPDAVSEADLRAALAKGMPTANNIPALRFGDPDANEGLHDLVLAHCLLVQQSEGDGPSLPQIISLVDYLASLFRNLMNARLKAQARAFEERIGGFNPVAAVAARAMQQLTAGDHERTQLLLDQLVNASNSLKADLIQTLMAIEAIGALSGEPDHRPGKRQRLISDALLDSAGVDRQTFDAYFARRAPD